MEEWKDAVGWEGYYTVSNYGRVKSIDRIITHKNGFKQRIKEKFLIGYVDFHGYLCVDLRKTSIRKNSKIHKLVMEAFYGPRPNGYDIRHLDGDCLNNHISNLSYGTRQDNVNDTKRHGRIPCGDNHWNVKIPSKEISNIIQSDKKIVELAKKYGVSTSCIHDIKHGIRKTNQ